MAPGVEVRSRISGERPDRPVGKTIDESRLVIDVWL